MATGITRRHRKGCSRNGRCDCPWEAWIFSKREDKKIAKRFARESEAKTWRADALTALERGELTAPKPTTVEQAWGAWETGAKAGTIRNRSGDVFKPSTLRAYEQSMRLRVLPEIGNARLSEIRRPDLQDLVDGLLSDGLNASTIQCALLPLRAIYRRAISRGELNINPCSGLTLPAIRGRRERYASPTEAEALLGALAPADRVTWATALYAGLRRGELRALRDQDVNLAAGVIHVERGWDHFEGAIELKSSAGRRRVPIAAVLRDHLTDQRLRTGRTGSELFFGESATTPARVENYQERADKRWKAAGLERITPHECRHTFASLMIAAGVNAKALSTYMGHANISITLDRYGHLMPGSETEAAGLLDAYLDAERERADDAARAADPAPENRGTGAPTGAREPETA